MRSILQVAAALLFAIAPSSDAHSVKRNPLNHVSRLDDPIIHTPLHRVHAYSTFDLTFYLPDEQQHIRLTLEPNHDVLAETASVVRLGADGRRVHEETVDRLSHRVFKGHTFTQDARHQEWIRAGWARITVSRDGPNPIFQGVFRVDGNHHHIKTASSYRKTQLHGDPDIHDSSDEFMVVWKDTDIIRDLPVFGDELKRDLGSSGTTCSSDGLGFNNLDEHPVHLGLDLRDTSAIETRSLFGRQTDGVTGGNGAGVNLGETIGSTAGCPTTRRVALIGIATDCNYRQEFASESDMRENVVDIVNTASALYEETFNISLGIQNLTTQEPECPPTAPPDAPWNIDCDSSATITDRLNIFSQWRGSFTDTNAYWTLLSTCATDSAVGLAWLGQVCSQGAQSQGQGPSNETIASANVVVRTDGTEWQVFAHETGHTFGAFHDCVSETCSDGTVNMQKCCPFSSSTCSASGDFIMNPSTSRTVSTFSPCSVGNICSAMGRNSVNTLCLTDNRNVPTITGRQCGNGIVEMGEECDCGGPEGCGENSCCDPGTCTFRSGAVCDPANEDCCTDQCRFASSGTVCRASSGSCDPEETCSGTEAMCPSDVTSPDGQGCGASGAGLTCASGQCTSRDQQCRSLVGTLTSSNSTSACSDQGCLLACSSPELGPNECYNMQQYFLDGTPCDGGGTCSNGQCQGANVVNQVGNFLGQNLNIVIPVGASVGGLLLLCIACCIFSSCRKRSRARKSVQPASNAPRANVRDSSAWAASSVAYPPPVSQNMTAAGSQPRGQWGADPNWPPRRVATTRYA